MRYFESIQELHKIMNYFKLKNLFEEQSILNDINGILNWDMATYMPLKSKERE